MHILWADSSYCLPFHVLDFSSLIQFFFYRFSFQNNFFKEFWGGKKNLFSFFHFLILLMWLSCWVYCIAIKRLREKFWRKKFLTRNTWICLVLDKNWVYWYFLLEYKNWWSIYKISVSSFFLVSVTDYTFRCNDCYVAKCN